MERIKLNLPVTFHFSTTIQVRITDINYGNHLGNDVLVSLLHESRSRFLRSLGYSELDIEGVSIIMADLAVQYKGESFVGDELTIELSVQNIKRKSIDLFYKVSRDGQLIAAAKTGIVFFNYDAKKAVNVPEAFSQRF